MTGVPLFLFAFLVGSWKMNGKAEDRWLGTSRAITNELHWGQTHSESTRSPRSWYHRARGRESVHSTNAMKPWYIVLSSWLAVFLQPAQKGFHVLITNTVQCVDVIESSRLLGSHANSPTFIYFEHLLCGPSPLWLTEAPTDLLHVRRAAWNADDFRLAIFGCYWCVLYVSCVCAACAYENLFYGYTAVDEVHQRK